MAAWVAQTIATWSEVEVALGHVLARLLGAEAGTVAAMHAALNGFEPRADSLEAAARVRLPPDDADLFQATMSVIRRAAVRRHEFAHRLWGHCAELPEALLLVDPKDYWRPAGIIHEAVTRLDPDSWHRDVGVPGVINPEHVMVYRYSDVVDAQKEVQMAIHYANCLSIMAIPVHLPQEAHAELRHRLLYKPQIRSALDKLRRGSGPRQEALPPPRRTSDVY